MPFVVNFTPGETFDETGDTITLAKLNRVINSGYGVIASGSLDADNIGNGQVTAAKLETVLDLTGKTVTLPLGIDLSMAIATADTVVLLGTPAYKGQIGILTGDKAGRIFIAKGTASTADWVFAGYLNIDGSDNGAFGVPDQLGQWAMDSGGNTYRAVALTGSADRMWMPVRSRSVDLVGQIADPSHLDFTGLTGSGNIRLYNKSNQLYMLQDDGTVVQVSGLSVGVESIYLRFVKSEDSDGGTITPNTWTSVPLNQIAGVEPAAPASTGPYPWFVDFNTGNHEITLMGGTYDYIYNIVGHQITTTGSVSSEMRGQLYFSNDSGEMVDYSESITQVQTAMRTDSNYFPGNFTLPMVGQFEVPAEESRDLRLRTWTAHSHTKFGLASSSTSYDPGIVEVYAFIKLTKVS